MGSCPLPTSQVTSVVKACQFGLGPAAPSLAEWCTPDVLIDKLHAFVSKSAFEACHKLVSILRCPLESFGVTPISYPYPTRFVIDIGLSVFSTPSLRHYGIRGSFYPTTTL
jgi:hypothetical protein